MWMWVILMWLLGTVSAAMRHQPAGLLVSIIDVSCDIGILFCVYQLFRGFMRYRARKRAAKAAETIGV